MKYDDFKTRYAVLRKDLSCAAGWRQVPCCLDVEHVDRGEEHVPVARDAALPRHVCGFPTSRRDDEDPVALAKVEAALDVLMNHVKREYKISDPLMSIRGGEVNFKFGITDRDHRFGYLAFGVLAAKEKCPHGRISPEHCATCTGNEDHHP